jgi:hypothetical protein
VPQARLAWIQACASPQGVSDAPLAGRVPDGNASMLLKGFFYLHRLSFSSLSCTRSPHVA